MLRDVEKKFVLIQLVLLGLFAWGVGFLFVVSTPLFNTVQREWALFCFAWEGLAFAVPLTIFRPMFQPIRRYVSQLEAGSALSAEQVARYHRKLLAYPFKVSLIVMAASIVAYGLGVAQIRYFARLPWEAVVVTFICGLTSGLLWGVLEYFLLEYYLRPLTGLAVAASPSLPPPAEQVSLKMKIFACSVALVVASLSFFGVEAYTRAEHVLEEEIGAGVTSSMRELANLMGALPRQDTGGISDAWRWLAAEFPVSQQGYFHLVDRAGRIVATHPAGADAGIHELREEDLLPEVWTRILTESEGYATDRVDRNKIISFVGIPGTRLKIVAFVPMRDFSPQLDQLLYSGLAAMAFALALALGIGFLCARSITTSIAAVTRTAQAVAEERDLTRRVRFLTNDEVGVLAHAFNQMAEGLQTYSEGLEHLVADRTQQLEQRGEQLEATNRELSDFLYIASHDLRSPLINLAGFSRSLQDSISTLDTVMSNHDSRTVTERQRARSAPVAGVEGRDRRIARFHLAQRRQDGRASERLARPVAHRNPPAHQATDRHGEIGRRGPRYLPLPDHGQEDHRNRRRPAGRERRPGAHQPGIQQPHRQRHQVHGPPSGGTY